MTELKLPRNLQAFEIALTEAHEHEVAVALLTMAAKRLEPHEMVRLIDHLASNAYPAAVQMAAMSIQSIVGRLQ